MDTEKLVINDGWDGQVVEKVHHLVIYLLIILCQTLSSEVKKWSELSALMIASKHIDCVFELYFDGKNETKDLDWEWSPVDIVP
jgi:hypothetical protein